MLARFVPIGVRELQFAVKPFVPARPRSGGLLALRGVAGGAIVGIGSSAVVALLSALGAARNGNARSRLLVMRWPRSGGHLASETGFNWWRSAAFTGGLVVTGAAAASRRNEGVLNPADLEDEVG